MYVMRLHLEQRVLPSIRSHLMLLVKSLCSPVAIPRNKGTLSLVVFTVALRRLWVDYLA